jgi:hypothetical protein
VCVAARIVLHSTVKCKMERLGMGWAADVFEMGGGQVLGSVTGKVRFLRYEFVRKAVRKRLFGFQ